MNRAAASWGRPGWHCMHNNTPLRRGDICARPQEHDSRNTRIDPRSKSLASDLHSPKERHQVRHSPGNGTSRCRSRRFRICLCIRPCRHRANQSQPDRQDPSKHSKSQLCSCATPCKRRRRPARQGSPWADRAVHPCAWQSIQDALCQTLSNIA